LTGAEGSLECSVGINCGASRCPTTLQGCGGGFIFGACPAILPFFGVLGVRWYGYTGGCWVVKPDRLNATERLLVVSSG